MGEEERGARPEAAAEMSFEARIRALTEYQGLMFRQRRGEALPADEARLAILRDQLRLNDGGPAEAAGLAPGEREGPF